MKILLFTLLYFFIFVSCGEQENVKPSLSNSNKNEVEYAQNFKIFRQEHITEIQIFNPEKSSIEKKIICFSNKQYLPKREENVIYIQTPVNGIVCLSSTHIGMLNKINALSFVKGIDNPNYIHNKYILSKVKKHKMNILGSIETINPERILNTQANIIMYSGFGKALANEDKLQKLHITAIANYDWKEIDPLGKAEWIKIFGVLTNQSKEAETYFNKIKNEYLKLKSQAKKLTISNQLLAGSMIGDSWYMPAGDSYLAKIFRDAKIDYVAKQTKGVGSYNLSLEKSIRNYHDATYWINPGARNKKELLSFNKRYSNFKAFKKNNLFCYYHNPNYYWENSAIEPQKLLNDLIIISHPNEYRGKLYFYKKLKNE
jgi:iron complex transport system substrate-binding protein